MKVVQGDGLRLNHAFVGALLFANQGGNLLKARHLHESLVALLMQVGQLQAALVHIPLQPFQLLA